MPRLSVPWPFPAQEAPSWAKERMGEPMRKLTLLLLVASPWGPSPRWGRSPSKGTAPTGPDGVTANDFGVFVSKGKEFYLMPELEGIAVTIEGKRISKARR